MALDHPAVNLASGRWLPHPRIVELAVVVALTVAVVVVAAVWESSSDEIGPTSVSSVAPTTEVEATPSTSAATSSSANATVRAAPVDSQGSTLMTVSEAKTAGHDPTELAPQAGIGRENPVFSGRSLPVSFERYQVVRGETLASVAADQRMPVSQLLLWNPHLDEESVLIPGEWISIPQWNAPSVADEPALAGDEEKSGRGGG